jgi:hypothetical protein
MSLYALFTLTLCFITLSYTHNVHKKWNTAHIKYLFRWKKKKYCDNLWSNNISRKTIFLLFSLSSVAYTDVVVVVIVFVLLMPFCGRMVLEDLSLSLSLSLSLILFVLLLQGIMSASTSGNIQCQFWLLPVKCRHITRSGEKEKKSKRQTDRQRVNKILVKVYCR